jgi:hypothetical protein
MGNAATLWRLAVLAVFVASCTRELDLGGSGADGAAKGEDAGAPVPDATLPLMTDSAMTSDGALADVLLPTIDAATIDAATIDAAGMDAMGDSGDAGGKSYVFITRAKYNPKMGGTMGGDARCQSSAAAAGLIGAYRAWLSDESTDAISRISGSGPWLEVGTDKVLFPTLASLRGFPDLPLQRDEYGDPAPTEWWTGTSANGVKHPKTCLGFTSDSQFQAGLIGTRQGGGRPGMEWTQDREVSCIGDNLNSRALLCFRSDR